MPAPRTKQYLIAMAASQSVVGFSPQTDQRVLLTVQNTGAALALLRFDNAVQFDGGDIQLLPGQIVTWDNPDTCPRERLNSFSYDGTTLAVVEGVLPK